jgi:hypothetical protein
MPTGLHTVYCTSKGLDSRHLSNLNSKHHNDFSKERKFQANLFRARSSHALEAQLVRLMNFWHLVLVLLELVDQLRGVELAVASASLDNLGLLLQCEVLPGKVWANVLLEEGQDLVVRDSTRVGEIVDTSVLVFSHKDGGWEEVVENGVGVGNIYHSLVLGDLGDEVA